MTFEIEHEADGTFTVRQDRKVVGYEDDLDFAERMVKDRGGTKYTLVEQDGYRTPRNA